MSESTVKLLCFVVGLAAVVVVWPLLARLSVQPAAGVLVVTGLVLGVFVSNTDARRFASLMRLWLGVLIGGLAQWGIHAARFPDDPYSYGFNVSLALAVSVAVIVIVTLAYLVALFFNYCLGKLRPG